MNKALEVGISKPPTEIQDREFARYVIEENPTLTLVGMRIALEKKIREIADLHEIGNENTVPII
ncbi:MAG: hypothetical protein ACI82H_001038 [Alphaproteobacteria bacterium]|jgi:hypothetical protein